MGSGNSGQRLSGFFLGRDGGGEWWQVCGILGKGMQAKTLGRQGEVREIGEEGSEASGPYPLAGVMEYGAARPVQRGRA